MSIHPTAIIEDGAELGDDVEIGPYCHIGPHARVHDGVVLKSHVAVVGVTEIGARCVVHPFAALGGPPQHLAYKNEPTELVIGEDCVIREHVTMNPGTEAGGGVTRVGARGFFMIGSHVAHDCTVGSEVIFSNNAVIGGHVHVGDGAVFGGLAAVHQHCRIGAYAFVGGCAAVAEDLIPYGSATGNRAYLAGLNVVGMKRRGMGRDQLHALRSAYQILFGNQRTFKERIEDARGQFGGHKEVAQILDFVDAESARPLMTPTR